MKVKFQDIALAFDYVSAGPRLENQAFLDRSTGKLYYHSDYTDDIDNIPDDIDDPRFIGIPHKNDLNLGRVLVFDFVIKHLPEEIEYVESIFSRRGAYSRFKALLERKNMLDKWYEFENHHEEKALRAWCKDNGIDLED